MVGEVILIIEPEDAVRSGLSDILSLEEYVVREAVDYQSGLQIVHNQPIELVILPYRINAQTGEAFVNALHADPATASTRILVHGKSKDPRGWQPQPYLAAYYTVEEFLAAVRQALDTPLP